MSSLSYLKQFPLDVIKIDGSFVRKLLQTPLDQAIIQAISQIAHSMKASTVAECAEDMATVDLLSSLSVDYVQGWATGRPEPLLPLLARAGQKPARGPLQRPQPLQGRSTPPPHPAGCLTQALPQKLSSPCVTYLLHSMELMSGPIYMSAPVSLTYRRKRADPQRGRPFACPREMRNLQA